MKASPAFVSVGGTNGHYRDFIPMVQRLDTQKYAAVEGQEY